jgi:hypothetical protein
VTTKMLRLPALAHERAVALAQLTGQSIGAVVSEAIDRAYREAFWQAVERQTTQAREQDPAGWAQYQAEVAEWDEATDGFDDSLDDDGLDDVPAIRADAGATPAHDDDVDDADTARPRAGEPGPTRAKRAG